MRFPIRKKRGGRTWHPPPVSGSASGARSLGSLQVYRAGLAALVILKLVRNALLLFERGHPGRFHSADVDEGIAASSFIRDEAVTLAVIEKFHGADWHI